jgi:hypothetical protein
MSDLKWFLLCMFSLFLLIIGLSSYGAATHSACVEIICSGSSYCSNRCYNYTGRDNGDKEYGYGSYQAGIAFIVLGSIVVLSSFPILTRRLANKPSDNEGNAGAEQTEVVEALGKEDIDDSAILQEQIRAQTVQIQTLTERLSKYEELPQEIIVQQNSIAQQGSDTLQNISYEPYPLGATSS